MSLLHWAILAPFIMAVFVPFLRKKAASIHTGWFVLILPVVLFSTFLQYFPVTMNNGSVSETAAWIPSLGIDFTAYVDGLSLLFVLLITGIGALVVLYSIFYLSKTKESLHHFYVYLLMFMGAMLGVVLSDNVITLYMFWEFTSISSFLLIAYWYDRDRSRYGALKSMLITVFGGLMMLGGFLVLSIMGNTFSIRELAAQAPELNDHPLFLLAMILVLLGAFTKSAQFPFYIWLPDAMEAPTPVSAYLHSATMVKAGIYLVARFSPIFAFSGYWFWIVGAVGLFTMAWASFNAVKQTDLKGILAFSTVSQLGLIMSLLGIGAASLHFDALDDNIYTAAVIAAVFHLINHATFKGSLFMVVGIIDHETGTRDIRKLGGLMSLMPITFTLSVIGAFSMAGLPPFNGFLSKEMFLLSMIQLMELNLFNVESWALLFPVLAWVGSVFTFIYSMMIVFKVFTGKFQPEKLDKKPHEAPLGMLISPIVLALLVVVFGLFPNLLSYSLIQPAAAAIVPSIIPPGEQLYVNIYFWHGITPELLMTIGVIIVGLLLYKWLPKWMGVYDYFPGKVTLNHFYNASLYAAERGSNSITNAYMTGFIRSYLVYIFAFFIAALGFTMWAKEAFTFDASAAAPINFYEVALVLVLIAATLTILFAKSRLTSIISLGAVGYTVSLFFVIFRAPDLALTQLVIETVSTALFLLCFYHLPKLSRHEERRRFQVGNAIIAAGVGMIVTLIGISAHSSKFFDSINAYYIENTYTKAGGENMVNVILVDFRGFDTLFEIAVLSVAALGIYGLIKLRLEKGGETNENE
ncbi:Na+/H+ antiporter subunit A [Domibacillus enclensis]|uniref:Multisubunit sodium/proton antiporter, MrpA subunit n=1 Tax=Domibacillus enclensis TaxID=1017273 RepID=A0A1N6YFX5_9BACI|nr:Na+/H+ antiporter subunit A [Domibacillus enclensis]OXS77615.1 Na+/H+ antiporter subunit A [Domibacillus enclensis]SIR13419.1 multisubunit sodium/proton antiporter, MrpA subunit [Domibacillus enclensis]